MVTWSACATAVTGGVSEDTKSPALITKRNGHQRLQELATRQKQRIIAGADDQHHAQRFAMNLCMNPRQPEWPSCPTQPTRLEKPDGFSFQKTAGFHQR